MGYSPATIARDVRMMRFALIASLLVALPACGATPVAMTNDTGKVIVCSTHKLDPFLAQDTVDECVRMLEAQGWHRP